MKTVSEIYKHLCAHLTELEARIILKQRVGIDWASIIANPDQTIETDLILKDFESRKAGKPLSRIYGQREFWGLTFEIDENTLDPRPDSETLIEQALAYYKDKPPPKTILDLGTGTGCLLLALLHEFKNAKGIGIDISESALKIAQKNAKNLALECRATFKQGNWGQGITEKFDLIVSNPPYIETKVIQNLQKEVRNHDPIQALDGGNDGVQDYNKIFPSLKNILKPDGMAVFEIGFDQGDKITRLSKKYGLYLGDIYPDLAGNPRAVDIFINNPCGDK